MKTKAGILGAAVLGTAWWAFRPEPPPPETEGALRVRPHAQATGELAPPLRGDSSARGESTAPAARLSAESWTGGNPGKAAQRALRLPPGETRRLALLQVVRVWALQAPGTALAWARELPDPQERLRLLDAITLALEQRDLPEGVTEETAIHDLEDAVHRVAWDPSQQPLVENLAAKWAGRDLDAALAWVRSLPEDGVREALVHRVAIVQSKTNPGEAARLVVEQIPAGPKQTEAVISVVHQWALQDLAGALDWVNSFPGGILKERAAHELEGVVHFQQIAAAP